ncbi:Uncharacterised protein [Mycobacteroides abscessus subsp. abscessus]|nr:Uncharacterised protein [Mycobacteroides abscessus subsp. abscessus]
MTRSVDVLTDVPPAVSTWSPARSPPSAAGPSPVHATTSLGSALFCGATQLVWVISGWVGALLSGSPQNSTTP